MDAGIHHYLQHYKTRYALDSTQNHINCWQYIEVFLLFLPVTEVVVFVCGASWRFSHCFLKSIRAATWQNQQNDCAPSGDSDEPGIRPVWSESSLWAQWVSKYPSFLQLAQMVTLTLIDLIIMSNSWAKMCNTNKTHAITCACFVCFFCFFLKIKKFCVILRIHVIIHNRSGSIEVSGEVDTRPMRYT